ncbi:MAG: hypothetical protein GQ475_00030 [Methylococcaceae bacterium]|nr:hypothetical protein [Methylococcaceae bacterium]
MLRIGAGSTTMVFFRCDEQGSKHIAELITKRNKRYDGFFASEPNLNPSYSTRRVLEHDDDTSIWRIDGDSYFIMAILSTILESIGSVRYQLEVLSIETFMSYSDYNEVASSQEFNYRHKEAYRLVFIERPSMKIVLIDEELLTKERAKQKAHTYNVVGGAYDHYPELEEVDCEDMFADIQFAPPQE